MTDLRVAHASMQFSDTDANHEHDTHSVFRYAHDHGVVFLTGTEGTRMRGYLHTFARQYGFHLIAHETGEWAAVRRSLAGVEDSGFEGPFIRGTRGMKAAMGGHQARGIAWITATVPDIGVVTVGAAHFLTQRSIRATHTTNEKLIRGIAEWGRDKGAGRDLVIFNGDVNSDDQRNDVFKGRPFTTAWDEVGKWPGTHGNNSGTIDISASYDLDGRVSVKSAAVVDDRELPLAADHFMILATYRVKKPEKRAKP